jgi:hypothetical protein
MKQYKFSDLASIDNFKYYAKCGLRVSQIGNFLKTSALIHTLLLTFIVISFATYATSANTLLTLPIIITICYIIATIFMFVLARMDPGIIRKQIPKFEYDQELNIIPVDSRALYE